VLASIRRRIVALAAVLLVLGGLFAAWSYAVRFPPVDTPEGAYFRLTADLGRGDARTMFAYLEDEAQHACYSIRDYRKRASDRVAATFPQTERERLLKEYRTHAEAADGADVWLDIATRKGFVAKLRRDLSGIAKVERVGERATIETTHGTRYAFRRRANGMWGLSLFTAELAGESSRAARDWDAIDRAASDYERAGR
jgi:hypothetical protein